MADERVDLHRLVGSAYALCEHPPHEHGSEPMGLVENYCRCALD